MFMHTVVELRYFLKKAAAAGMTDQEREALVSYLAGQPDAGDAIPGTGGCRKVRWGGMGKGKRGGFRVITFFSGETIPVFLLTAYAKNEKADLTSKEARDLANLTRVLVEQYRKRVTPLQRA